MNLLLINLWIFSYIYLPFLKMNKCSARMREAGKINAKRILLKTRHLSRSEISESASLEIETVRVSLSGQRQIVSYIAFMIQNTHKCATCWTILLSVLKRKCRSRRDFVENDNTSGANSYSTLSPKVIACIKQQLCSEFVSNFRSLVKISTLPTFEWCWEEVNTDAKIRATQLAWSMMRNKGLHLRSRNRYIAN